MIAVADGQCLLIVEQGKVVDVCAEPGEYTYEIDTEPSLFTGDLGTASPPCSPTWANASRSEEAPMDQRVYFFNTKELIGNKYGTPSPCRFAWSTNERASTSTSPSDASGSTVTRSPTLCCSTRTCAATWRTLFPAKNLTGSSKVSCLRRFSRHSPAYPPWASGIRASGKTRELACVLKEELSEQWRDFRGIEIQRIGVSSVKADEGDERMIKEMQRNAAFRDPTLAAAYMVGAQGAAMQAAAENPAPAALRWPSWE